MFRQVRSPFVRFALFIFVLDTLGAAGVGVSLLTLTSSQANQAAIVKLNAALDREAAAASAAARVAATQAQATRNFIGEINYICTTQAEVARRLGLPQPAKGLCILGLP